MYHINLGAGRFALCLAASRDLKRWRKIADLDPAGGSMGTIRALPDGGYLVAYEAQRGTTPNRKTASNLRLRYYRSPVALLNGRATEQKTLPRRLSRTNEGTPDLRSIAWRGSLATSRIVLGFHYLDRGPKSKPFKLAVDRQARGTEWLQARFANPDDQASCHRRTRRAAGRSSSSMIHRRCRRRRRRVRQLVDDNVLDGSPRRRSAWRATF